MLQRPVESVLELSRNPVPDGSAVIILEDVTERLRTEATILHWAHHGSANVKAIADWADARRDAGDVVIGFNIHPMLIKDASDAQVARLVDVA